MDDLAATLDIAPEEIQLAVVETVTWTNTDLGCTAANLPDLERAIEGYRFVLLVGDAIYEYHTDDGSMIRRCGQEGTNIGDTSLLVEIDPVAAELVALAQRRTSQELGVSTGRIHVVEVTPYTWLDSSLGCPAAGEDYTSVQIDGYRIVLAVGGDEYVFHTDFDRLLPCDEDREVLPAPTPN
jgi:hypothetical protein